MHVREPVLEDAEALGRVHVRAWQLAYRGMMPDGYLDGLSVDDRAQLWRDGLARPRRLRRVRLVAEHDGQTVGFVVGGPADGDDDRDVGEVYALNVDPDVSTAGRRPAAASSGAVMPSERCERRCDAERALRAALSDVEDGTYVPSEHVSLATWLTEEWLPSIKPRDPEDARRHRGTVSIATWSTYRRDLERYVLPRIGGVQLQSLSPAQLDDLYDELEREGGKGGKPLAAKTVANIAGVLHKALADAVKRGRLKRNPADAVSPPTARKADTRWWSVEELRRFLVHVTDDELYAAWLLFATTGARTGEVAGLTWDDLDLDDGWMRVDWTLGHVGHRLTWKPRPKSRAGARTMALDPATVAALREHRRRQLEDRMLAGPVWEDTFTDWQGLARTGLVWTYGDGSPIHPKTLYERFLRHAAAAGLPRVRLHDVRHSYASAALASATGWHDVKVISQRLGHASVAITLDTYSHVLPAADEAIANTLANVILGTE